MEFRFLEQKAKNSTLFLSQVTYIESKMISSEYVMVAGGGKGGFEQGKGAQEYLF